MARAGAVWVDVLPSMANFSKSIAREVNGLGANVGKQIGNDLSNALAPAGKQLGNDFASNFGAGLAKAEASVSKLGAALSTARDREATAAGRVRVAESQLDGVRSNSSATAAQLVAAEERLAAAQRTYSSMQAVTAARTQDLTAAHANYLKAANNTVGEYAALNASNATWLANARATTAELNSGFAVAQRNAAASIDHLGVAMGIGEGRAASLGRTLGTALGGAASKVSAQISELSNVASARLTAAGRGISSTLSSVGITGGVALAGLAGGAAFAGIKFDAMQESSRVAFTTMLHSGPAAAQMMAQLNDFAARTPFELANVTTAAQRLMAYGFDARDVIRTLTAIGDAVSGLGGGAQQIDQVTTAIGQMTAKGKIQSDEILQLTEAGIPALRILANQYGVTTGQMQDMITKGLVPASEAVPKLLQGMEQGTRGAAGETQAFAGMMEQQSHTMIGVWSNFKDNFTRSMGTLVQDAMPGIKAGIGLLSSALAGLPSVLSGVETGFSTIWQYMQPVANLVIGPLSAGLSGVGWVLTNLIGPALSWTAGLFRDHQILMATLGGALTGLATVLGVVYGWQLLMAAKTLAWAAAQWVLNTALLANPITWVVIAIGALVGAVIYAWTHFDWFRGAVFAVWDALKTGAAAVWSALVAAFNGIVTAVQAVGSFFSWLGDIAVAAWNGIVTGAVAAWNGIVTGAVWLWGVLSPIFDAIGYAARFAAGVLITVLVTPSVIAFNLFAAVLTWLWSAIVSPVFSWIGGIISWLWTAIVQPVFGWIGTAISAVGGEFSWLWSAVIAPVFAWIGGVITGAWTSVIQPVFGFIGAAVGGVGGVFSWLWSAVIQPVFAWIGGIFSWLWSTVISAIVTLINAEITAWGAVIQWLWTSVIQPVFGFIGGIFSWLYNWVVLPTVSAIKIALGWLGDVFMWVWTNVITPAFHGIGDVITWVWTNVIMGTFDAIKAGVHWVGQAFQDAVDWIGRVWDTIKGIAAAPVNWVIDVVFNNGIAAVWNKVADWLHLPHLAPAPVLKFAEGGVLPGYAPRQDTVPAMMSPGEGVLVPEAVRGLGGPGFVYWANSFFRGGGTGFANGGLVQHFAGGGIVDWIGNAIHSVGDFLSDAAGFVGKIFTDPAGAIQAMFGAVARGAEAFTGSTFGQIVTALPREMVGKLVDWVKGFLGMNGPYGAPYAAGGPGLDGWIMTALGLMGLPPTFLPGIRSLIMSESGGNPNAINLWDSNARAGHPSQGLMQTIPSTFAAYVLPTLRGRPITDPVANITAGVRYALATYGPDMLLAGGRHNAAGGYVGYDEGGVVPPGFTPVLNQRNKPEALLTDQQWALAEKALTTQTTPLEGMEISGRLELDDDGFARLVDGRIESVQQRVGSAINTGRRL